MKTLRRLKTWLHRVTAPTDRVTQGELDIFARSDHSKVGIQSVFARDDIAEWLKRQDEWEMGREWSETEEEADAFDDRHWISEDDWLFHTAEAVGHLKALCPAAGATFHERKVKEDVEGREYKITHMED